MRITLGEIQRMVVAKNMNLMNGIRRDPRRVVAVIQNPTPGRILQMFKG